MARDLHARSSCDDVLEGVDMTGRSVLVTGGSGGLGAESARALAGAGATVVLAGRDLAKTRGVAEQILDARPGAEVEVLPLSLDSLASVRACADAYLARYEGLDVLLENAAVMACPLRRSAEGYDLQFATNHLGHFLLAELLLPALRQAAPSRVVVVGSGAHWFAPVQFDDIRFERSDYHPWVAYGQAKSANALFALEFERRHGRDGVHAYSLHPGAIHTELGRHLTQDTNVPVPDDRMKTLTQGASTQVYLASAPERELEGFGGRYFEDCAPAEPREERVDAMALGCAPWARDPELAAQLWELSERAVAGG